MTVKKRMILTIVIIISSFLVGKFSSGNYSMSASQENNPVGQEEQRQINWLTQVHPLDYSKYDIGYCLYNKAERIEKKVKFLNGNYLFSDESGYSSIEGEAYGELDNDGQDEAVTILFSNCGGSGSFPELAVLKKDGKVYTQVASTYKPESFFADRIYSQSIEIKDKIITVKIMGKGPDDAGCCPTVPMEMKFKLNNNRIEAVK